MRLLQIGSVLLSDADAQDDFSNHARSNLLPLKNGSFDHDGNNVIYNSGSVSRRALLVGEDLDGQMDTLQREMARGRLILKAILRDDDRVRSTYAKFASINHPANVKDYDCKQPFTVQWSQDFPFWWDDDHLWFLDSGESFDDGLYFDGNYQQEIATASPHTFTILYGGTAKGVLGALIVVPRAGGQVTNLRVSNAANNMEFRYTGTVAAETRLDIDFLSKTVLYASTDAYDGFSLPSTRQSTWMQLEPGGNNIEITFDAITGIVDLYWQFADLFI